MQQRAASAVPRRYALRVGLLLRVARKPVWLLGLACSLIGFILHAAALRLGSLVLVQPIMATSVIFALAFVALGEREKPLRSEWLAVLAVITGLVSFLILAAPEVKTYSSANTQAWWTYAALAVTLVGFAAARTRAVVGRRRALWLGLAAGLANGVVAVLTKAFAETLEGGLVQVPAHWPFWALLAAGIPAVILVQTVYQSGNLSVSLPVIAVVEPFFAAVTGVILLSETLSLERGQWVGVVVSATLMASGLWSLAASPRLARPLSSTPGEGSVVYAAPVQGQLP